MNKQTKMLLIAGGLAVVAFLAYKWYKNKQAANGNQSPTGSTGANLNSVAPELIGGSTGPSVGPALSAPVNITITQQPSESSDVESPTPMIPANNQTGIQFGSQPMKSAAVSDQGDKGKDVNDSDDSGGTTSSPGLGKGTNPGGPDEDINPGGPMKGTSPSRPMVRHKATTGKEEPNPMRKPKPKPRRRTEPPVKRG